MANRVERMLRKDQLSQNQANYQQRGYVFILHGYVCLDANHAWELNSTSVEKLAHSQRDFYIGDKSL